MYIYTSVLQSSPLRHPPPCLFPSCRRPYGSHSMRHFLHRGGHGAGGGPALRRWAQPVNAGEVPNELIEQAAAVLQGKSRDVIIRELQRTVSTGPTSILSDHSGVHTYTQNRHTHIAYTCVSEHCVRLGQFWNYIYCNVTTLVVIYVAQLFSVLILNMGPSEMLFQAVNV